MGRVFVLLVISLIVALISSSAASATREQYKVAQTKEGNGFVFHKATDSALTATSDVNVGQGLKLARVIGEGLSDQQVQSLLDKGCRQRHKITGAVSFDCPLGVQNTKLRASRVLHITDATSNSQIHADDVWALGATGKGVNIAIIDTGVEADHIELNSSYLGGKDFVNNDMDPEDGNGHGTHVAGIITADGVLNVTGQKVKGIAPDSGFYMLKVCDSSGFCEEDDVLAAIEYAVQTLHAKIISMSLGGDGFSGSCDDDPLAAKVNWAADSGSLVIVAAGNGGDDKISTPACASKAVAVGAVDSSDKPADWSSHGKELDLVAPGVNILSTYSCQAAGDCNYYWYTQMGGTSMATPHVAGVAALLLSNNTAMTESQLKEALYGGAKKLAGGTYAGNGRVDALGSLEFKPIPANQTKPAFEITNVLVKFGPAKTATVSWQTSKESSGYLLWGNTKSVNMRLYDFGFKTQKSVLLMGLTADATYYFKIVEKDRAGNLITDDNGGQLYNFTLSSAQNMANPLEIANVMVATGKGSATIGWKTNRESTGTLLWGTDKNTNKKTYVTGYKTEKSVTLNWLAAGVYYFKIMEKDREGKTATDDNGGRLYNFTIAGSAGAKGGLTIGYVHATPLGTTAMIEWSTSVESSGKVIWGETKDLGRRTYDYGYKTEKRVLIGTLEPGKTYYFRVEEKSRDGQELADDNGGLLYSFTA